MNSGDHAAARETSATRTAVTVTVVFAVVAGLLIAAIAFAARQRASVQRRWAETLVSWEELLQRHPARGPNGSAQRLEASAAKLGVDIAPRWTQGRPRPSAADARAFSAVKKAISEYLSEQIERRTSGIEPPPAEVKAFLDRHREDLEALQRELAAGTPRWSLDLTRLFAMELPNLLGHIDLQRLLLADALARAGSGDGSGALDGLEASWQLNEGLRDDPVLIVQLIAISIARLQAGTLRHIDGVPAVWQERLQGEAYRRRMIEALAFEGWLWLKASSSAPPPGTVPPWERVISALSRPYVRYCLADLAEAWRLRVVRLSRLDYLCDRDLAAVGADLNVEVPWWNRIGQVAAPNMAAIPGRLARLELDLELTRKLLEIQAARDSSGAWPGSYPGIETSAACPDDGWVYRSGPAGAMSIEFERPLSWSHDVGVVLPTGYATDPGDAD